MPCIKYSQRLLNPFRGSMNIIEYEGAEAVSLDGVHWDIYVRNQALAKDMEHSHPIQLSDIHYGHWTAQSGLKRGPVYACDNFRQMQEQGARVHDFLLSHHHDTPFPFLDHYELWLLDSHYNPLALIDSSLREPDFDHRPLLDWRAGQLCCNEFTSKSYAQIICADKPRSAGAYLTGYINQQCGLPPRAQWFKRNLDKHGIGMRGYHIPQELIGRELNENAFEQYMLSQKGHDRQHGELINEFIHWQSPLLLLLDSLSKNQRRTFEQASRKRALLVDQLHQLYPQIIEPRFINAARVEASLRKNNAQELQSADDHLHTEYIERLRLSRD